MRATAVVLGMAVVAGAAAAQPAIRRPQPKAFPLAVTPSAGLGFGSGRARYYDPNECASEDGCYEYGTGSGWQAGVDVQVPLGRFLGFELSGQVGRPSLKQCLRGQCITVDRAWSIRGSATVLWRLKPRAPVYFGLGAAYAYFDPGPILIFQDATAVGEVGGTAVLGVDFALQNRIGGRVAWRGYFLVPSSKGLPDSQALKSIAWDNALSFGVRVFLGQ
jgi:hypothetical protein